MSKVVCLILVLTACLGIMEGCGKKSIDSFYTHPDAITGVLNNDEAAKEACNPNFIAAGSFYDLSSALTGGNFATTRFKLNVDSSRKVYDIHVGDTVHVDSLSAKEANARINYQIYYTLTLENAQSQQVIKHLKTNSGTAHKNTYFLELGSFSGPYRGWVFWGTSPLLNLDGTAVNLTWKSEDHGQLSVSDLAAARKNIRMLSPGDSVTVNYTGSYDEVAFLNINESGTPRRIKFRQKSDNHYEAGWTVSAGYSGRAYYYYAGLEAYRLSTLASTDTTQTIFVFSGLMYSIDNLKD